MDNAEFAILGAGAIGSIIGAHLAHAGRSVIMLARERRALQIRQRGLRIRGLVEFSQPVPVLTDPAQLRACGVLIVAIKTHATEAALAPLSGAAVASALSIQNGMLKDQQLAHAFGAQSVLGAVADTSGELLDNGDVMFTRNANLYVGELDGSDSRRAREIASTVNASGVHSKAVTDIQSLEWSKFAAWAGMMVLSVTTRAATWKYAVDPGAALVLARIVREVGSLAEARGIQLSDQSVLPVATICAGSEQQAVAAIRQFGMALQANAPTHRMSTLQDLQAGRSLEVDETLGHLVSLAQQTSSASPLLSAFYPLIAAMSRMAAEGQ